VQVFLTLACPLRRRCPPVFRSARLPRLQFSMKRRSIGSCAILCWACRGSQVLKRRSLAQLVPIDRYRRRLRRRRVQPPRRVESPASCSRALLDRLTPSRCRFAYCSVAGGRERISSPDGPNLDSRRGELGAGILGALQWSWRCRTRAHRGQSVRGDCRRSLDSRSCIAGCSRNCARFCRCPAVGGAFIDGECELARDSPQPRWS
jgi:hypothetical protein